MSTAMEIPQTSPLLSYEARKAEIDKAIGDALARGRYILGDEVSKLEQEFAAYIGVRFAVGVGSGTDALHLALWACGVQPGDEVITVSHTAVATAAAVRLRGAKPVFVDVDEGTMNMDPALVAAAVTPRTKAIVPVHLYGHPADLAPIVALARERKLRVVEDCAQSHGAQYKGKRAGGIGDLGCFSFYPTKNLGALGDGGMVVTDDAYLAERLRLLRQYGWRERYVSEIEGSNSRLDEIQAAVLRVKLRYLDEDNGRRREHAASYGRLLANLGLRLPVSASWAAHCYHQYVVRSERRDELSSYLKQRGVGTLVHYPIPIHLQPAYRGLSGPGQQLPVTERLARVVLSLPMFPELRPEQLEGVGRAIAEWVG